MSYPTKPLQTLNGKMIRDVYQLLNLLVISFEDGSTASVWSGDEFENPGKLLYADQHGDLLKEGSVFELVEPEKEVAN